MIKGKKILIFYLYFVIFSFNLKGQTFQNLAQNGSFETYTQCPYSPGGQIFFASPWTGPTFNSTDYYNSCSLSMNVPYYAGVNNSYPTYLLAKDGSAYAGIYAYFINDGREYAQLELASTMIAGVCYYVEFFATYFQRTKYYINNIAASLLSTGYPSTLNVPGILVNVPMHITNYGNPIIRDTVNWKKISGIYEATGIEKFIILGNFRDNSNTDTVRVYPLVSGPSLSQINSYIFLDAISVFSINPSGNLPWSYRDTTIIKGDSVYIGNKMGGLNFHPKWYDMNGNYLATNAGITVRPINTSSYVIQYTICGVQRADTIEVKVLPDVGFSEYKLLNEKIQLFPNPAQNLLSIIADDERLIKDFNSIIIYNNLGQIIREEEIEFKNKEVYIKTDNLLNGVYVLQLKSIHLGVVIKRFVISR